MARLIVIDESSYVIATSKHVLGKEGYSYIIQGCDDVEVAISFVKESVPDLILLNLDTSGIIGLKRILTAPETASIPIIVTATDDKNLGRMTCITALWWGARDYLLLPIDEDELIQRVQTQMSLS